MKQQVAMPELTFHGLDFCDLCGEPLNPGETLAGVCRACRVIPPPRRPAPREPRRKNTRRNS